MVDPSIHMDIDSYVRECEANIFCFSIFIFPQIILFIIRITSMRFVLVWTNWTRTADNILIESIDEWRRGGGEGGAKEVARKKLSHGMRYLSAKVAVKINVIHHQHHRQHYYNLSILIFVIAYCIWRCGVAINVSECEQNRRHHKWGKKLTNSICPMYVRIC